MQQAMLNKSRADKFLLVFDVPPILKQFSKKFKQSNTTLIPDSVQFSIFGAAAQTKAPRQKRSKAALYVAR